MDLPRGFVSLRNFELAYTRVLRGVNKDYKQFYSHLFPSYTIALRENLVDLIDDVRRGTYKPSPATVIFQPKRTGVLRPLSLLSLRDLIVYQALANQIANAMEPVQSKYALKRAFGGIYAGKQSPFFSGPGRFVGPNTSTLSRRLSKREIIGFRISIWCRSMS
jgi:hypothetical protein